MNARETKWARDIIALQADGQWGCFHTLSAPHRGVAITTEQALRRLRILGYTAEDAVIRRSLVKLRAGLRGDWQMPDHREKTHDWDLFTRLIMATWIRQFVPEDPEACAFADRWAGVITAAFAGGDYDHAAYTAAYERTFGIKPRGARFIDFASFYVVALLPGRLDAGTERAMIAHLLAHPAGIYYIMDGPLGTPPAAFATREASRYLGAIELLAAYEQGRAQLSFVRDWLEANREADGWDFGPKAKDGIYFPLSDSWRTRALRMADCTARIEALLRRL